jgi:hypothetical protein
MTKDDRVNRRLDNYSRILSSRDNLRSSSSDSIHHFKIFEESNKYKNAEDTITISTKEKRKTKKGGN